MRKLIPHKHFFHIEGDIFIHETLVFKIKNALWAGR